MKRSHFDAKLPNRTYSPMTNNEDQYCTPARRNKEIELNRLQLTESINRSIKKSEPRSIGDMKLISSIKLRGKKHYFAEWKDSSEGIARLVLIDKEYIELHDPTLMHRWKECKFRQ